MTNYFATIGLMLLFIADYTAIIMWLMRTADIPDHTIRFSMRGLFVTMTFVAIHLAMFTAFIAELTPLKS
jgi:ABC-type sulfate transport system permease component